VGSPQAWKKLGRIEIIDANRIKVRDCYQCAHMLDVGKPFCPGEAGIIAGILDKTPGGSHCVKETKCW
jgi:predicted hydrocarbon binding protein